MTPTPAISVVIPSKDRPDLLPRTLLCAAGQRGIDCEVIVVDDGSAEPYAPHVVAPNARVIRHETARGVAQARNTGIEAARGRYVAFLDDDDLWGPDRLRAIVAALEGSGAKWGFTAGLVVTGDGDPLYHSPPITDAVELRQAMLTYDAVPYTCSNLVVSTEVARELAGYDSSFGLLADWDFALRVSQTGDHTVVADPLVAYVLHGGNMVAGEDRPDEELGRFTEKHPAAQIDHGRWLSWRVRARWVGGDTKGAVRLLRKRAVVTRNPVNYAVAAAITVLGAPRTIKIGQALMPRRRATAPAWLAPAMSPDPEDLARVWRSAPG